MRHVRQAPIDFIIFYFLTRPATGACRSSLAPPQARCALGTPGRILGIGHGVVDAGVGYTYSTSRLAMNFRRCSGSLPILKKGFQLLNYTCHEG
jgi:hypothetical protein